MNVHGFLYMFRILLIVIGYNRISGVLSADYDIIKMRKHLLVKGDLNENDT
jgi:hypothetical protein